MPVTASDSINERYLQKEFVEQQIFEIMAPFLAFKNVLPAIQLDARSIVYKQEKASHSSDSNKKKPRIRTASADWSYVNIQGINIKSGILNQQGLAVRIDRDAIRFQEGVDEINRAFQRVAYWLAEDQNNTIISQLQTDATGPTTALGSPTDWDAAGASPVKDLMRVAEDMRQEGYPYRAREVYIHDGNFAELNEYVTFLDNRKIESTIVEGSVNDENTMQINRIPGMTVHGLLSGITEGDLMALDSQNPAGALYYSVDPKFSVTRVDDQSVSPLQIHRYTDDKTHDEILQLWYDYTVVTKEPKAVIYASSAI